VSKNWNDITLALAGIFQATSLVEQAAKTGYLPPDAFKCSIESIFALNPENTLAVYGGSAKDLRAGLELMRELLKSNSASSSHKYRDILRYSLGILHLQKKLSKRNDMLNVIRSRLEQVSTQVLHFSSTHDNVIANLGGLYSETLSTFKFRIQVNGDYNYLQQQRIANQIRALLLAAIRSAILWRQLGGNRLQLLLNRKDIAQQVDILLRQS
jgi:high frequency lysogenization protein